MKKLLLLSVAVLLLPCFASAQLLVFKGASSDSYLGEGHTWRIVSKMIIVVDYGTGNFGRIDYTTFNGSKHYNTATYTNAHLVHFSGPNAKPYTAVTRIPPNCEGISTNSESVYFEGADANLSVNPGITVSFPKTLSASGRSLLHAQPSGSPVLSQGALLGVFNSTETMARNQAGDTLDDAIAGYIAYVQSLGYSQ
jgi:hypothetical protein